MTRESETQAEDEQSFLTRQLQLMQQGAPSLRQDSSPMRSPAGVQKTGERRSSGSPGVQGQLGSPKKVIERFILYRPEILGGVELGKLFLESCGSILLCLLHFIQVSG